MMGQFCICIIYHLSRFCQQYQHRYIHPLQNSDIVQNRLPCSFTYWRTGQILAGNPHHGLPMDLARSLRLHLAESTIQSQGKPWALRTPSNNSFMGWAAESVVSLDLAFWFSHRRARIVHPPSTHPPQSYLLT